jgi:hypothetical protein
MLKEEREFRISEPANAQIPDSDMPGWIETLRQAGLTEKETELFLSRMNATYGDMVGNPHVEQELKRIVDKIWKNEGRALSEEEKKYLRESIKTRRPGYRSQTTEEK